MTAKKPLNRRDFLSLRVAPQGPTLELSCRVLYDQFVDAEARLDEEAAPATGEGDGSFSEPQPTVVIPSQDALIARIEEDLRGMERLRLLESDWLASSPLGERMAPVLDAFCARGGQLEFVKKSR